MSIEDNKKVVLGWFENRNAGNRDATFAVLADDFTIWIQGSMELSGTKTKAELAAELDRTMPKFDHTRITPTGVTAEGDRVAVEAESYATLKNGKVVENTYHFLFVVRDGKIESIREYFDTAHVHDLVFAQD